MLTALCLCITDTAQANQEPESLSYTVEINNNVGVTPVVLKATDHDGSVVSFEIDHFTNSSLGVFYRDPEATIGLVKGEEIAADGVDGIYETLTVYFVPAEGQADDARIFIQARDNEGFLEPKNSRARITVKVHDVSGVIGFTSAPVATATQEEAYTYSVFANGDGSDPLTITANVLPAFLTLSDNGDGTATLNGTPTATDVGNHNVELQLNQNGSVVDTQTFILIVFEGSGGTNMAPNSPTFGLDANEGVSPVAIELAGLDPDGTVVAFRFNAVREDLAQFYLDAGLSVPIADNYIHPATDEKLTFYVVPNPGYVGKLRTLYASIDNLGAEDLTPGRAELTIKGHLDVQIVGAPASTDTSPFALTIDFSTLAGGFTADDIAVNNGTVVSLIPDDPGSHYSSYTATILPDGTGDVSIVVPAGVVTSQAGTANSASSEVVVELTWPPVFTSAPTTDATEDVSYSYTLTTHDGDDDNVAITAISLPSWLTLSATTNNADNTASANLSGTPTKDDIGTHSIVLVVSDGTGSSAIQNFDIVVSRANDAPTAIEDSFSGNEDIVMAGNVLANDTDLENDPLTAILVNGTDNGLLVLNSDGSFTYTPDADFNGSDSFTYLANDGEFDSVSAAAVILTVLAENDVPTASDDTFSGSEDTVISGNVLANDTDPENDPLTAILVNGTDNGLLVLNSDGSFTYTPNANFNGSDSFTYLANDGTENSDAATVTLNVASVNDAPEITSPTTADEITIPLNEGEIHVTDIEATDTDSETALTFNIQAGDDADLFEVGSENGEVTFRVAPDFEAPADANAVNTYVLTVVVSDDEGASDALTIRIGLEDVDEIAPTATISAPAEARDPFQVTITFSEDVLGFEQSDVTIENAVITDFAGSGAEYSFTVVPGDTGVVTVSIPADAAVDTAGNGNEAIAQVSVDFVNEEAVVEETQQAIEQLLTQRNRITMNYKPTIERRLQRLSGNYLSNGEISAFGFTYRDSRLPMQFSYRENEIRFAYSYLQSQVDSGATPSLTGRFGGSNHSKSPYNQSGAPSAFEEPPSLTDSFSARRPVDEKESEAIHAFLMGNKSGEDGGEEFATAHELDERTTGSIDPALALGVYPKQPPRISNPVRHHDPRIDVWIEGTYGQFDIDQNEGSFGVVHVGFDYLLSPNLMLGLSAQMDWLEAESTVDNVDSTGSGFMIGPYVTARLAPKLLFDGRLSWGRSRNRVTPSGGYTDEFDSERWLFTGALIGSYELTDQLSLSPEARISWHREDSESYVDGLDVEIPTSTIETGTMEFGPTLRGSFKLENNRVLQPSLGIKGVWTFAQNVDSKALSEQPEVSATGLRARVEVGIDLLTPQSHSLSLSGFYDGVGEDDYESWGSNLKIRISY